MAGDRARDGGGKWVAGGLSLAALLYLLLRRGGGDARAASTGAAAPCRVQVDQTGLLVDGSRAALATAVAKCREAGSADVTATGAAIVGTIAEVVRALVAAGVIVRAQPSIWQVIDIAPARSP